MFRHFCQMCSLGRNLTHCPVLLQLRKQSLRAHCSKMKYFQLPIHPPITLRDAVVILASFAHHVHLQSPGPERVAAANDNTGWRAVLSLPGVQSRGEATPRRTGTPGFRDARGPACPKPQSESALGLECSACCPEVFTMCCTHTVSTWLSEGNVPTLRRRVSAGPFNRQAKCCCLSPFTWTVCVCGGCVLCLELSSLLGQSRHPGLFLPRL